MGCVAQNPLAVIGAMSRRCRWRRGTPSAPRRGPRTVPRQHISPPRRGPAAAPSVFCLRRRRRAPRFRGSRSRSRRAAPRRRATPTASTRAPIGVGGGAPFAQPCANGCVGRFAFGVSEEVDVGGGCRQGAAEVRSGGPGFGFGLTSVPRAVLGPSTSASRSSTPGAPVFVQLQALGAHVRANVLTRLAPPPNRFQAMDFRRQRVHE